MSQREIELALKKQRLQFRSAALRDQLAADAAGLHPLFHTLDRIQGGVRWLGRHPHWVVAGLVALLVARPKAFLRWGRRSWFAWQTLRRLKGVQGR